MTRLSLIPVAFLAMCSPAHALTPPPGVKTFGPRAVLLPGDTDCLVKVEVWNLAGRYTGEETLHSEHGPILIRYETVGLHQPGNDDVVEVLGLPDGLHAIPMRVEIPDGETAIICVNEYIGG